MKSMLYPKLAWQNLKNNRTTYFPYLLTCSVSVAMYYIMQSITLNERSGTGAGRGHCPYHLLFRHRHCGYLLRGAYFLDEQLSHQAS